MSVHPPSTLNVAHAADALLATRVGWSEMRKAVRVALVNALPLSSLAICAKTKERILRTAPSISTRAQAGADIFVAAILPMVEQTALRPLMARFDAEIAEAAGRETGGNVTAAAALLKIHRNTFYGLIRRWAEVRRVDVNKAEVA